MGIIICHFQIRDTKRHPRGVVCLILNLIIVSKKHGRNFRKPRLLEECEIPHDIIKASDDFAELERQQREGVFKEDPYATSRRRRREVGFAFI